MTKKIISDGWHEQKDGTSIYTESGIIVRAINMEIQRNERTLYI